MRAREQKTESWVTENGVINEGKERVVTHCDGVARSQGKLFFEGHSHIRSFRRCHCLDC